MCALLWSCVHNIDPIVCDSEKINCYKHKFKSERIYNCTIWMSTLTEGLGNQISSQCCAIPLKISKLLYNIWILFSHIKNSQAAPIFAFIADKPLISHISSSQLGLMYLKNISTFPRQSPPKYIYIPRSHIHFAHSRYSHTFLWVKGRGSDIGSVLCACLEVWSPPTQDIILLTWSFAEPITHWMVNK